MIRDRVDTDIIVSFRVLPSEKRKEIVRSKMSYKLSLLVPNKFEVDPDSQSELKKYVESINLLVIS